MLEVGKFPPTVLTLFFGSILIVLSDGVLHCAHCVALLVDPAADWLEIFNSQSGSPKYLVLKCNTETKTEHTI